MSKRVLSLLFALSTTVFSATAQTESGSGFGWFDPLKVFEQLPQAKELEGDFKALRDDLLKDAKKIEDDLRKAEKALIEKQNTLSASEFEVERKKFEERLIEVQGIIEKKQASVQEAFEKASKTIQEAITAAVKKVAAEKKLNFVFLPFAVSYANEKMDISNDVAAIVKTTLKDVRIKVEPKK